MTSRARSGGSANRLARFPVIGIYREVGNRPSCSAPQQPWIDFGRLYGQCTDQRAEELLHAHVAMTVDSSVFDALLAALDAPAPIAPAPEKALVEPRFQNR